MVEPPLKRVSYCLRPTLEAFLAWHITVLMAFSAVAMKMLCRLRLFHCLAPVLAALYSGTKGNVGVANCVGAVK